MDIQQYLPDFYELKPKVLEWLRRMRIDSNGFRYQFSPNTGHSLFTTCFALYILDLFRETDNLSTKDKQGWANYINSFQRKEDGMFYPDPIYHQDKERAVYQATSFCLSALKILDSAPGFPLVEVDNWRTKSRVEEYLIERGCHLGKGGSGNKAMFQAIFLTHEYERSKDPELLESINVWFDFHNLNQNRYGFWGTGSNGQLYKGLQNAFHQFVIYEYWNKEFPRLDIVVQTALDLQNKDGFFSDLPGGSSCMDYDSLHFLFASNYNITGILEKSLGKALNAIQSQWNEDGGFCENSIKPYGISDYPRLLSFILFGRNNKIRLRRGKEVAREVIKPKKFKSRAWVKESQPWGESTLWDTWFRCLTIAEISCALKNDNCRNFKFPEHIGIGYKKNQDISISSTGYMTDHKSMDTDPFINNRRTRDTAYDSSKLNSGGLL